MTAGMEIDCADEYIDGQIEAAESLLPDLASIRTTRTHAPCCPSHIRCRPCWWRGG